MGLPIWRDPEEPKRQDKTTAKDVLNNDPTASARSSIRRRPEVHGRRTTRRLPRDLPPRFERSPPSVDSDSMAGFRRRYASGVPPVSTLLEHADRSTGRPALPPAPMPEAQRVRDRHRAALRHQERELQDSLASFQRRAASLDERLESVMERAESGRSSRRERLSLIESAALRTRLEAAHMLRASQTITTSTDGPLSQDMSSNPPNNLPTPPHETSQPDAQSLFLPEPDSSSRTRPRRSHPLSNTWRADSPINGLGDRNRSPTPADGWEIMRTTITPDTTLPSADSSFTSAAVNQSFGSNAGTVIVGSERSSSSDASQHNSSEGQAQTESVSSLGSDDGFNCDATEDFANDMYLYEMATSEGRERIRAHQENRRREGDRFALAHEPERVDLGFRLIEEALESQDGRERLTHVGLLANRETRGIQYRDDTVVGQVSGRPTGPMRTRSIMDNEPPSPDPESMGASARSAALEARGQVADYFRRFAADALTSRPTSPPPQYEPAGSNTESDLSISHHRSDARPLSPRDHFSVGEEGLGSDNDDTELETMRRVIARIAQRDDVPDEWWTSIGLNLSRIRPSRPTSARSENVVSMAEDEVRTGRVDRGIGSRL